MIDIYKSAQPADDSVGVCSTK